MIAEWGERYSSGAAAVLGISSVTGAGLDELMRAVFAALPETETPPPTVTEGARDFEVEHRVYRPGEEEASTSLRRARDGGVSPAAASRC